MSNNDSHEDSRRSRLENVSQEDRELLLRNSVYDPLHTIIYTCRLLLLGESGTLPEKQADDVTQILKCAEYTMKAIDLHLEAQGIIVGRLLDAHDQNDV